MQEKSADCSRNCTFLVERQKGCTKGQCTKYKGQDNSQKSKVESEESRAGDGESGELYSPEKEERRESGLNPDEMNITLRGGNGLWMRMFYKRLAMLELYLPYRYKYLSIFTAAKVRQKIAVRHVLVANECARHRRYEKRHEMPG